MLNHVHSSRRPRFTVALVALAVVSLIAACGNDDGGDPDGDAVATDDAANDAVCEEVGSLADPTAELSGLVEQAEGELADAIGRAAGAFAAGDMGGALAAAEELTALCRDEGVDVDPTASFAGVWQLSADAVTPTYECAGADADSTGLLALVGDGPMEFQPEVQLAPIAPVPLEGEELIATLTGGVELDAELVSGVIAAGITEATVADLSLTLHPGEGATGDDLVGVAPDESFQLTEGEAVRADVGPFDASYTRTAPLGDPVTFTAGTLAFTVSTSLAGSPINLNLICEPIEGAEITLREEVAG